MKNGITMISLVITIIVMLILAGVALRVITGDSIIDNANEAVEKDRISRVRSELQEEVVKIATSGVREITMEKLIERLENKGIIVLGNTVNGQVITEEGYIFEIKLGAYRDIEINYIEKGELPAGTTLSLTPSTTGIAKKVTIAVKGVSTDGIKSYTPPTGTEKTYNNTPRTISETHEVTENGTYTFTIIDGKNNTTTETITISNILAGTIQMSVNRTMPTVDDVIVTINWPENTGNGPKQVKVGEGTWQNLTGATSQITIKQNCTVRARVINSIGEMVSASITIDNIDKTMPIVLATSGTETIDYGTNKEIGTYFTVIPNGTIGIAEITYINTSNGNVEVENTNALGLGTHVIKCIAVKETGATTTAIKTLVVEPGVYGNLYKISDTEYHLILNGTGAIAQGYTEAQLVARGTNIRDGIDSVVETSEGVSIVNQPWGPYAENIKKVKIEEKIKPRSTLRYFQYLSKITEIEGMANLDTTDVTNMKNMFYQCNSLTSLDVSGFDTSNVTNMEQMFYNCTTVTSLDVSRFDTKKVTNMNGMFYNCFNLTSLDVSGFDTSNVRLIRAMFYLCNSLTSLDVSGFNTSKATDMNGMFYNCFNLTSLDVSGFDTSNVTSMNQMFCNCDSLTNLDVGGFDTSKVTDMYGMFTGCSKLTSLDVSNFDTSNVITMEVMFYDCNSLTNLDVSGFDTSKVTNMHSMFNLCKNLTDLDVSGFNTTNVTTMQAMFYNCYKLTRLDLSNFDTSNVVNMRTMFYDCYRLTNLDISNFNAKKVTNMYQMFYGCSALTAIYVGDNWSTDSVTESTNMFYNCTKIKGAISYDSTKKDATYANWETGYLTLKGVYGNLYKISDTEYHLIFNTTGALAQGYTEAQLVEKGTNIVDGINTSVEVSEGVYQSIQPWGPYSANITKVKIEEEIKPRSTARYFLGLTEIVEIEGLEHLDTNNVTNMQVMFLNCNNLISLDVSNWNTSNVTNMFYMFENCSSLTNLNVREWNTSSVNRMDGMFYGCSSLNNLDVSNFDTSNVTNMYAVFYKCSSLEYLDVSNWDTSKVTNFNNTFMLCSNLNELDVSKWNTKSVTNMSGMFSRCSSLKNLDVSNWDTSSLKEMHGIFNTCNQLVELDLSNWDTSNVNNMGNMFYGCSNLTTIYAGDKWSTSAVTYSPNMFGGCTSLSGEISYNSSKTDATYANYTTGYLTYKQPIGVYGNLYKISDTEYHLIFNTTGAIAQGYSESQLIEKGTNIKNGSGYVTNSDGVIVSNQPWGTYSGNITKVKIEEKIYPNSTAYYFTGLSTITGIEGISNIDTSNVISMRLMFNACSSLTSIDVSGFDTSKVTNMIGMFQNCNSVTELDVSGFNTSKVKSMYATFYGCNSLTSLDISDFDTSNVVNMQSMFNGCKRLTSLDVSNFDTSNVTTMRYMFNACYYLKELDLTNFDTSKVTNMQNMFYACHQIRSIDVSSFDTSNVTDMYSMFWRCDRITNLDISNFNTKNVTNMYQMFYGCGKLTKIYVGNNWTLTNVTDSTEMFKNCTALSGAIAYDDAKVDGSYANHSAGYLTYVNKNDILLVPSTTASGDTLVTAIYGRNITGTKTLTCTGTAGVDYVQNRTRSVTVKTNQTVTVTGVTGNYDTVTVSLTVTR